MNKIALEEAYYQALNLHNTLSSHSFPSYTELEILNDIIQKLNSNLGYKMNKLDSEGLRFQKHDMLASVGNILGILKPHLSTSETKAGIINETQISMLPRNLFDRVVEADKCYKNDCYTACCALCGTVIEAILLEKIGKPGDETWDDVVKKFCKEFGFKHEEDLIKQMREWRTASNHLSSLSFDEDRAAIFLKTLVMVSKVVYKT